MTRNAAQAGEPAGRRVDAVVSEMETRVAYALAVTAAAVSSVAVLAMVFLTTFVVTLAFRARRTPDSRRSKIDLQTSINDGPRASHPITLHARDPAAGADRRA